MKKISSCVYGPVKSWRMGKSLGVDLLCVDSICSFECVYCQLGKINRVSAERKIYVSTAEVIREIKNSDWRETDVITFSGSGEPTLAANLGEAIRAVKDLTKRKVAVLTNSTLLSSEKVRSEIAGADFMLCKLDAWTDKNFSRVNHPHPRFQLRTIIKGIKQLRREFSGKLAIQTMILKAHDEESLQKFAAILLEILPDEVQLNLPSRPIPKSFALENRGNRLVFREQDTKLKTINFAELNKIRATLLGLTNLPVIIPSLSKNS